MAVTKLNNLINPEVMGAMIGAKIDAQLKLTPYAKVDTTVFRATRRPCRAGTTSATRRTWQKAQRWVSAP